MQFSCSKIHKHGALMKWTTKLPVKHIAKEIYPMQNACSNSLKLFCVPLFSSFSDTLTSNTTNTGTVTVSAPKKHEKNVTKESLEMSGNIEPVVALNKPRLPPVLGPLILLSLLEMDSNIDDDDF